MSAPAYHKPVLLHEAISALNISSEETYVDTTLGGGGHARAILEKLGPDGRLIGFDQDEEAWHNRPDDDRLIRVPENFRHLERFLKLYKAIPVAGILADLGVSSRQFDQAERGFSTRQDAMLDMRMDRRQKQTASDILRQYDENQLWQLFEKYGEVRNARTLAQHLVKARATFPLTTVGTLRAVIAPLIVGNPNRYLAQVFQALRIEVNDEMEALKEMLQQTIQVLKPGGRLVVITFHSLEDRIVKNFMKSGPGDKIPVNSLLEVEANHGPFFKMIFKKPVVASNEEIRKNPRARSAKLRVAERK